MFSTREFNKLKKEISIISEALREGIEIKLGYVRHLSRKASSPLYARKIAIGDARPT